MRALQNLCGGFQAACYPQALGGSLKRPAAHSLPCFR